MRKKTGSIPYTERAFLQDAQEAMGGDLVKGLIELITNADDSYVRSRRRGPGGIWVQIDRSTRGDGRTVVVKDRASGMTHQEMEKRLLPLGRRASGSERGESVRGNRGRGAKDLIAFGDVVFESIKDQRLSMLKLTARGGYELFADRSAEPADRDRLGIMRGNGTAVTVYCGSEVRIPRHDTLRHALGQDFQLRDIMADPLRKITLVSATTKQQNTLRYRPPTSEPLLETTIRLDDYPEAGDLPLTIGKLPERSDDPPHSPTRAAGILIKGERAIYDNTLFKFDRTQVAGWLHGRIVCTYIDQLSNEFDDRFESGQTYTDTNPFSVITRGRTGLAKRHPFWRSLSQAVERELAPLIQQLEEEERETGPRESPETRRRLDRLGREAARMLHVSLREIDDPDSPGPLPGVADEILIVPAQVTVEVGGTKTLSVMTDRLGPEEGDEVSIELDPDDVFAVANGRLSQLGPHRSRTDVLTAPIRVTALKAEEAILTATTGQRSEAALLRGIPELPPPDPVVPPETLQFERPNYNVGLGKEKRLEIWAPGPAGTIERAAIRIMSRDDGVTVLGGGTATLVYDQTLGFYVATIRIRGVRLGARTTLQASLGLESAQTTIKVTRRDEGLPDLKIEFTYRRPGTHRYYFDPSEPGPDGPQTLWIVLRHPSLQGLVGEHLAEGEASAEFRAVLAEVVAEALASKLVKKQYPPTHTIDAEQLYDSHAHWQTKLLPSVQKVLL